MKTFYFEISSSNVPRFGHRYFFDTADNIDIIIGTYKTNGLALNSDRVWVLDNDTGSVHYLKNRRECKKTPVDAREFVIVQLSARKILHA